jgi:hypothetical protein
METYDDFVGKREKINWVKFAEKGAVAIDQMTPRRVTIGRNNAAETVTKSLVTESQLTKYLKVGFLLHCVFSH